MKDKGVENVKFSAPFVYFKGFSNIKEDFIMTTQELSKALPEIITAQVPGPKSKELLERRDEAIPKALCGKTYPICIKQGGGAMFEDLDGNKFP